MQPDTIRILAVDDVEENLTALEAVLRRDGLEIVKARSGFDALELLLKDDFALALLDVQMPGMDGFELAELMRGTERTKGVPIMFLTALAVDERRRFRGFEMGAVDYLLKPLDSQILVSKVEVFCELARQRYELARQRDEIGAALARLRAHGDNSPLAVIELDSDLRVTNWTRGAERMAGISEHETVGQLLHTAPWLAPEGRSEFITALSRLILRQDGRETIQARLLHRNGTEIHGECYCSSLAGNGSRNVSIVLQVLDITERRRAEETQQLLVGELNHRVKNSLATVQAIAAQSIRHAQSNEDFKSTFMGRLQALAQAHSLLSAATWEGAQIGTLLSDQMALGTVAPELLEVAGEDIELAPDASLRIALVFHELITNANKYGALAHPTGRVAVSWDNEPSGLILRWRETGVPNVVQPERTGFGSKLIQTSTGGGQAKVTYWPDGIEWMLQLPASTVAHRNAPSPEPASSGADETESDRGNAPVMSGQRRGLPLAHLRILIVEDEPLVAMELEMFVEDHGGEALGPAASKDDALALIANARPDLVLLDGNLNGERVDAVAKALADAGIPFAFVSGYGRDHLPSGYDHCPIMTKPFDPKHLLQVLTSLTAHLPGERRSAA